MSNNVIKEYIDLSKKEITAYIKLIFSNKFNRQISDVYSNAYVDIRYYNFSEQNKELSFRKRLLEKIKITEQKLLEEMPEDRKLIENMGLFYSYIYYFDTIIYFKDIQDKIEKLNKLRNKLLNKNSDNFKERFYQTYLGYKNRKEDNLKKYESKEFFLKIFSYPGFSNVYRVNIKYDIKFPMIYSQMAIERAFNIPITNEDKLAVEYYLISLNVIQDIMRGNFKKHYILEFTETLLKKPKKIKSLLNIIHNPAMQEKISLKIRYKEFLNNKEEVYELMRNGFKIAVVIDDEFVPSFSDLEKLNVFSYIILNKKFRYYDEIIDNKVILNDNLIEI